MRKMTAFILCLCMLFGLCACGDAEPQPTAEPTDTYTPVTFTNNGKKTTVSSLPEKVITAGPNCTEAFCALGLSEFVIGKCMENHSLGAPEEYKDAVDAIPTLSVGYPTAQQIIDSGCDFIYASSWIFDDDLTIAQLEKAGITVYVSEATDLDGIYNELRDIAKIFLVDSAESVISGLNERIDAVSGKIVGDITEPKRVFVLDSFIGDMLYTAGGTNIESVYIAAAGGANVFSDLDKAWDAVEISALVEADPEYIIIHDYSGSDYDSKVAALKEDPVLSQLSAVQNENFIRLSLENAFPSIRCADTVETIAMALYPDCF